MNPINTTHSKDGSIIQTLDQGNNEILTRGIFRNEDGTWLAMTFTRSREFKTKRGALMWFRAACPGAI